MEIGETLSLQLDLEQSRMFWGSLQAVSTNMVSMTDSVLASVKDVAATTVTDHEDVQNEVKCLEKKCEEILRVIQQQTTDWLQHMEEEAPHNKEAGTQEAASGDLEVNMVEQQECRSVASSAELEKTKVLVETLRHSCPLQMGRTWQQLSGISPVLQRLCERTAMALEESKVHEAQRDQALEDRDKMQQELEKAEASLHDAKTRISDLNTQITILSTEMAALRQELTEVEQKSVQVQKCNTELSATITSTMASYAFLEQALGNETKKLVLHTSLAQEATEKASGLEQALEASQCRVQELTEALAQMESQAMSQAAQQGPLQTLEAEIARLNELNEFLDLETKVAQEQVMQSSEMLCKQLQSLRERNLECEDLKDALSRLSEELNTERATLLEKDQQMSQITDTITTLYERISMLTTVLEHALDAKARKPEHSADDRCTSTTSNHDEKQDVSSKTANDAGVKSAHIDGLGSTGSAFSRVRATLGNDKREKILVAADLADMFTRFQTTFNQYEQHRDAEQNQLTKAKEALEQQLHEESYRHQEEEQSLREQLKEVDRNAAAKLKDQDQKSLTKFSTDMNNLMEKSHKLKLENIALRKKEMELKQLLQQSEAEVAILKEEVTRAGDQSASTAKAMDERILLSKQIETLKLNLAEVEDSKSKIMEKAKRHESVHKINQSKLVRELHLLDGMVETVRKTLSSVPHVVNNSVELQKLMEYLG